ncbi:hypothetical protein BJP08_06580 [Corynebacterium sp. NML140438]|nr:hypothetical protein BJP08_06580 [Corynebacterium sp. NML140438]
MTQLDPARDLRCDPRQVLVLGDSVVEEELAWSFRQLGFDVTHLRTAEIDAEDMQQRYPSLTVAGAGVDPEVLKELEERAGSIVSPSVGAQELCSSREGVRATATDSLGLPTLRCEFVRSPEELEEAALRLGLPVVVKPGRSSEGQGQTVLRNEEELHAEVTTAWETALEVDPEGPVVVERFIEFDFELTILAARSVDPATGELATWFCEPIGTRHEGGRLVEAWQPAVLSEAAAGNARSIAARITGALGGQGLYAVEMFVAGDDVYFSDARPRPSLDGLLTRATQRLNQCSLHARAVIGLPIDATLVSPGAMVLVEGAAPSVAGLAKAMSVAETGVRFVDGAAVVTSTGESAQEARDRATLAASRL